MTNIELVATSNDDFGKWWKFHVLSDLLLYDASDTSTCLQRGRRIVQYFISSHKIVKTQYLKDKLEQINQLSVLTRYADSGVVVHVVILFTFTEYRWRIWIVTNFVLLAAARGHVFYLRPAFTLDPDTPPFVHTARLVPFLIQLQKYR